jgi:ABC transport system ATP-binding/permease protein
VSGGTDWIQIGKKTMPTRQYLAHFLLGGDIQQMKVGKLSGGERNRTQLAKLLRQGGNVLVLDEPTNDLDLVTLNVLEQLLLEFGGSVLLVTHDRYFLDKVATSILSFEEGQATRYPGNYEMYLRLRPAKAAATGTARETAPKAKSKPAKLSYKDQRELESMETVIEAAERRKAAAEAALGDPGIYLKEPQRIAPLQLEMEESGKEVERLYARWQHLQDLASRS